jgi:hypothetical protein
MAGSQYDDGGRIKILDLKSATKLTFFTLTISTAE